MRGDRRDRERRQAVACPERGDEVGGVGEHPRAHPRAGAAAGAERAHRAERERDVARSEADRQRLAVALVRDAADPAAAQHAGHDHQAGAEAEPAERLEASDRASVHPGRLSARGAAGHFPFAETPERYWPVVACWLEVTAPQQ